MFRRSSRFAAAALLAFAFTGCGGGGDDPVQPQPTPTASIALGAATATVVAGATTPVAVTLTRGGGFAGAVTLAVSGAPAGVSVAGQTIDAGATAASLSIVTTSAAVAGTLTLTISGTGTGVTIAPQTLALTITAAPPTASIMLGSTTATVVAGGTVTSVVTLTRGGSFIGNVVLAVTGAPAGVSVAGQTIATGATTATLSIVTTTAAVGGNATLTVTGTGTGVTIAPQTLTLTITAPISQIGSDITNGEINFGGAIALSSDGTRMVVGAAGSANGTTRVYQRSGTAWTQLGADIIGEAAGDLAGGSVDINAAGTRIAIGARLNSGGGIGAGHVRVYDLVGTTWTQVGADLDGTVQNGFGSQFGWRVALSGSGNRLIASANVIGFARVYDLVGGTWTQVGATLSGSVDNQFGNAVDVSSDGTTIAVSGPGSQFRSAAGSVFVYRLVGGVWTLTGNVLTGSQTTTNLGELFGDGISLTANGSRIAVAATQNREGPVVNGEAPWGQVRIFDLVGSTWTQVGNSVFGSVSIFGQAFLGETLMISDDGTRWAANAASLSEAKVYSLVGGAWTQTGATIVATAGLSARSEGLALSRDGKTVAVGYVNGTPRRVRTFSITP